MRGRLAGPGKGPAAAGHPSAAEPQRPAVGADPQRVPRWARGPQAESGTELPAAVTEALSGRLGFDVSLARIHADTQAAEDNRRLGSVAHTVGRDISFSRGAYAPLTSVGQVLLAHELTHVAQQLSGNTDTEAAQEREAESVAAGGSRRPVAVGVGTPALTVRLSRGDALSITLVAHPGGRADFTALLEGGGTATATGTVRDLPAGTYWARSGTAGLTLTHDDGTPMAQADFFDVPVAAANDRFVMAVTRSKTRMRLTVTTGAPTSPGGESAPVGPYADLRRQLDELPPRIKAVLFSSEKGATPASPEDYGRLLRIADKLAELSDEELAEYAERTTKTAFGIAAFEESVDAWVTELTKRRATDLEADRASTALAGMDSVYGMYRGWLNGLLMGGPPSWIADWEALPVSALPATAEGSMNELYLLLRRALQPFGYPNLRAFEIAIARFVTAFRESAITEAASLLDRYEHVLLREQARYTPGSAAVTSLHADLAPARTSFASSDEQRKHVLPPHPFVPPEAIEQSNAAAEAAERFATQGRAQVRAQADLHPLLGYANFPVDDLARSESVAGTQSVLAGYITESLGHVADTRARLRDNHELVFKLDILVTQTQSHLGIEAGSIWALIITDHQAPTLDEIALEAILAVLGVALSIASGGSALAAVAALGLSSFMALQTYEDYALRSDAYGAQLLSEEPWMGWVILAVIGAGAELGAVASVIRPIRPALRAFQETGDIAALEKELAGVKEGIRNSILARAELELQARRGWASIWAGVVPAGATRASIGLDLLAEQIGKVVYSIQLNLRRGINTFTKWRLTREAADLIGDINHLSPAQIAQVRALYSRAIENTQRIASHGRELGLTLDEVDAVVQNWARRGTGTIDEALAEMTAARKTRPAGEAGAWTPPSGWNGPSKYGRWTAARGNSGWIDERPEVIRIVGRSAGGDANPIPFRQGAVDFNKWSQGELRVPGLVGEHADDMAKIRLAIAERQGLVPGGSRSQRAQAALDWLRDTSDGFGGTGLRPHHAGGDIIELVPRDLHKVQHTDLAIYDID
jgi:hypothetical protein